jgi:hypothetical protein
MAASMAQDGTTLMARKGRLCVASEMWEDKASTDGTRSFTGREWRAYLELERTGAMWTIVGVAPGWIAVAATRRGTRQASSLCHRRQRPTYASAASSLDGWSSRSP